MLTPQQQLLMQAQAQGNLTSLLGSNVNDVERRRLQMLLSSRNPIASKDGQPNAIGDMTQNVGSPLQSTQLEADMILKVYAMLFIWKVNLVWLSDFLILPCSLNHKLLL